MARLLGHMRDPRAAAATLHRNERKWLRDTTKQLDLADETLKSKFEDAHLSAARAAYMILTK